MGSFWVCLALFLLTFGAAKSALVVSRKGFRTIIQMLRLGSFCIKKFNLSNVLDKCRISWTFDMGTVERRGLIVDVLAISHLHDIEERWLFDAESEGG